jgi:uncharacterized protein (TIGR02145 family)
MPRKGKGITIIYQNLSIMKKIINSTKRTLWFKASMAILTCLMFLILPSCQKNDLIQDPMINMSASASSTIKPKFKQEVTDVDGNIYTTVKIGKQLWMAENLKTTKYSDGTSIPNVTDDEAWTALTTPGYCWYNNEAATYKNTYGALYNWFAVNAANNGGKNLCPTGWHAATDADWHILILYLDPLAVLSDEPATESLIAGGKLKETGTIHWQEPNNEATNEVGFTALPGGYRGHDGIFDRLGTTFMSWMVLESGSTSPFWWREFHSWEGGLWRGGYIQQGGMSVRCVKD